MKNILKSIFVICLLAFICSCEKDEGKLPNITFKTAAGYASADVNVTKGATLLMGINASKAEDKDVLKKFNISKSVNGAAATSVFDKDLSGADGDSYAYDLSVIMDTVTGQTNKFTFTVTNRDGLVNQVSLTATIQ